MGRTPNGTHFGWWCQTDDFWGLRHHIRETKRGRRKHYIYPLECVVLIFFHKQRPRRDLLYILTWSSSKGRGLISTPDSRSLIIEIWDTQRPFGVQISPIALCTNVRLWVMLNIIIYLTDVAPACVPKSFRSPDKVLCSLLNFRMAISRRKREETEMSDCQR